MYLKFTPMAAIELKFKLELKDTLHIYENTSHVYEL